jgi:predicted amidohydrolase YtcJ
VLSQDIFAIDPAALLEIDVIGTMVGGELVYGQDGLVI